jgi:hypothetical protein
MKGVELLYQLKYSQLPKKDSGAVKFHYIDKLF